MNPIPVFGPFGGFADGIPIEKGKARISDARALA
jgi:hypothetical protein